MEELEDLVEKVTKMCLKMGRYDLDLKLFHQEKNISEFMHVH